MIVELRRAVAFAVITMVLFGGVYHAAFVLVGQLLFREQAEGSLIRRADGRILGSRLVAQAFRDVSYVRSRPSAVDYDAASTGGSNLGPANPDHLASVRERTEAVTRDDQPSGMVPGDLVTTSGSGVDPHLSPAAVRLQAARVADARAVTREQILALIESHIERPTFGLFGSARVNVLELNLALDERFPRAR
ncbi:MAG: potassium-transporting ATPase subunit KdpC [Vicinamibacterales bacterium]